MFILSLYIAGVTFLGALSLALFHDVLFNTKKMDFSEKMVFSLLIISCLSMWIGVITYLIDPNTHYSNYINPNQIKREV